MATSAPERIELDLEGMTCASCAARIEKRLNKVEGVEATVNYATEQATVRGDADVAPEALIAAVEAAGYHARVAAPAHDAPLRAEEHHRDEPLAAIRRRLVLAAVLTTPVVLAMVSAPFARWDWAAFVLSPPVVYYAGLGFHRAALRNARHTSASMDT